MDVALLIAKSGLDAHHKNIEIISNNLANVSTTAFKKNRAEFTDLPYQIIDDAGVPLTQDINKPTSVAIGTGTKLATNKKIFTDGAPIATGTDTNMRISGRGFFQVQTVNGAFAYTRDGSFVPNETGQLATSSGYILQPPITIAQGTTGVSVSQDGIISGTPAGSTTSSQIGQIQIGDFINPDGLTPLGDNLYQETISSGTATLGTPAANGLGAIQGGYLEASNVNVVEEMVNLIEAQRAFEVTSKAVSAVDNMLQLLSRET